MKKIILLVLPFFFLVGCKDDDIADSKPLVMQVFECSFTNLKPEKHLKVSFECLERKKKDSGFELVCSEGNYISGEHKDNLIVVPKEVIEKSGEVFHCYINLFPYFPIGFNKAKQDAYVGTKLTYIMRIYKDEELLWEKKLEFPQKDYKTIKIEL